MLEHSADGAAVSEPGVAAASFASGRLTRILVADDHEIVRVGLRAILEARPGWKVVAEAADGKEAMTRALASKPDIVIMDYCMPIINGVEATRQVRARLPNTEIMIFTAYDGGDVLIREVLQAGARAYLLKSEAKQYLIAAVDSLVNHKLFFTRRVSEQLVDACLTAYRRRNGGALSPRERMIVQLIAEGHRNKEIAAILNLSVKTIETHRATTMSKLNVASTAAIVRYAVRNQLVAP